MGNKVYAIFSTMLSLSLFGADQSYLDLYKQHPGALGPLGHHKKGEIEIVLDEKRMDEIEQKTGRKVGIIAQDRYWVWINDAVIFPKGNEGVYGRVLWRQSLLGPAGVAVMAVTQDKRIALIRTFRHATRSWEYELPRGGTEMGESPEQTAIREAKEETGLVVSNLVSLGEFYPDTGVLTTLVPVFLASVERIEGAEIEETEAIDVIETFSLEELKQGFVKGYLEKDGERVNLRDPFLTFALFQAEIRGFFQD